MPTRLLLEGSDIEALLARVHAECGADARIVSTNRVRSGGVAGFFARERFEVVVDVPGRAAGVGAATGADDGATAEGSSALEAALLSAIASAEAGDGDGSVQPAAAASVPSPTTRPGAPVAPSVPGAGHRVPTVEPFVPAPVHRRTGTVAPEATDRPVPHRPLSTEGGAFADVLGAVLAGVGEGSPAPVPVPATSVHRAVEPPPARQPRRSPEPRRAASAAGPRAAAVMARPATALADLGVPAHLLHPGEDAARGLVRVAVEAADRAAAPQAPVVVVVGPAVDAVRAAQVLAERRGLDPGAVALVRDDLCPPLPAGTAVPLRLRHREAARWSAGRRQDRRACVVAVDTGDTPEEHARAMRTVAALGAAPVVAVVDARRRTRDHERALRVLATAGRVAGLAVTGAGATSEPAAVLALGLPVLTLDDRPATAGAWTALLTDLMCAR